MTTAVLEEAADTTEVERKQLQLAVAFAVSAHHGQFRKYSGLPYVTHCFEVLAMISKWGLRQPAAWRAALCHDVLEDCPEITPQKLRATIGGEATALCEELTFRPDPDGRVNRARQKEDYLASFAIKSPLALLIKCADRACNTQDFIEEDQTYAAKYWRKGAVLYDAMHTRSLELEELYGFGVVAMAKFTRDSVNRQIVR